MVYVLFLYCCYKFILFFLLQAFFIQFIHILISPIIDTLLSFLLMIYKVHQ